MGLLEIAARKAAAEDKRIAAARAAAPITTNLTVDTIATWLKQDRWKVYLGSGWWADYEFKAGGQYKARMPSPNAVSKAFSYFVYGNILGNWTLQQAGNSVRFVAEANHWTLPALPFVGKASSVVITKAGKKFDIDLPMTKERHTIVEAHEYYMTSHHTHDSDWEQVIFHWVRRSHLSSLGE